MENPYTHKQSDDNFPESDMLTNSLEKPHACEQCDMSFMLVDSLEIHIQAHSGEQHCTCKHCA